ncbi:TRAF family member-associated NF-kappa-B activator-like [Huso huso]|uniref:TRAF family member-associated NF-kappa-B activator-like n=1 Tax=Huso huso TaxID=61971 RepID=A0ABR0Y3G4_HUSHU
MEQAFVQLQEQFFRLRALCIRQAEMLDRLTARQGFPNDAGMPVSMPIQCTEGDRNRSEGPFRNREPLPTPGQAEKPPNPAGDHRRGNYNVKYPPGTDDYDVLANGLEGMQIHCLARKTGNKKDFPAPPLHHHHHHHRHHHLLGGADSDRKTASPPPAGANGVLQAGRQTGVNHVAGPGGLYRPEEAACCSETVCKKDWLEPELEQRGHFEMPWMPGCQLDSEVLQLGGILLSNVTLNSQVCEFCQAVFPSETTTRGEYLRHITAHIT